MLTCSAVGCDNRPGVCEDKSISFHEFPLNDKTLLKQWLEQTSRGKYDKDKARVKKPQHPSKSSVLCSIHFTESCYEVDFYYMYGIRSSGKKQHKKT